MTDHHHEEKKLKKKLYNFILDLHEMGGVKGFQYFDMYTRGREEIIISVLNELDNPDSASMLDKPTERRPSVQHTPNFINSFTSHELPYDKRSFMLSQGSQLTLSGYGDEGIGLPPASPSDTEITRQDDSSTLFLLAAYGRYNCPYVWVRSNHQRLVKLKHTNDKDKDNPLKLKSTARWKDNDIKPWDIVADIVKLCMYPPPSNPFAVDTAYFDSLGVRQRLMATAGMINLLNKVIIYQKEEKYYTTKVMDDIAWLTKINFEDLRNMASNAQLPVVSMVSPAETEQIEAPPTGRHQYNTRPMRNQQFKAPPFGKQQQSSAAYQSPQFSSSEYYSNTRRDSLA